MDHCGMTADPDKEARDTADIIERLIARYPHISAATVQQVVAEETRGFDDAHVRDFVPVFVERQAKARLDRADAG
jgi:hypothetical protein